MLVAHRQGLPHCGRQLAELIALASALAGDLSDGPRFLDWNFVASSKERLAKAAADWRASIAGNFTGTWFSQPPNETAYIPLPGDPQPTPMDHIPDDHDENW